jgi:parvulin-like peptidyl-prolyl isomerase
MLYGKCRMKLFLPLILLVTFSAQGQSIDEIKSALSKIQTLPEAHEYARSQNLRGDVVYLVSGIDTTAIDVELIATNKGDVIDFDSDDKKVHFFYKTIVTTYVNSYRLQYIYLNTWKHTIEQVDSTRAVILKRASNGESFDKLAREYSMDVNASKGGDRGWFEQGRMQAAVEDSMKERKLNEVYTIDVPAYKWYYVIKKTHEPRVVKKNTVFWIEIDN